MKGTQNEVKTFTFRTLSSNAVKSLFTIYSTGKTTCKDCCITLEISNCIWLSSVKTYHPENLLMYYSEVENNGYKSSNRSTSLSYQSDCILIFRTFCRPLAILTILTEINYLIGMEMRANPSQFFSFSWFFNYFGCHLFINCLNSSIANFSYPPWKSLPASSISF